MQGLQPYMLIKPAVLPCYTSYLLAFLSDWLGFDSARAVCLAFFGFAGGAAADNFPLKGES